MADDSQGRRRRKPEKFIGYFRLVDACAEPGCPVCRLVTHDSRRSLTALLYEHVTDPTSRRRVRASWGFCNWHAWMLLDIDSSLSGAAIIYEDILGAVIQSVRRLAARPLRGRTRSLLPWLGRRSFGSAAQPVARPRAVCPICETTAEAEDRHIKTMLSHIGEPDFQLAYARSEGLCLPHTVRAVEVDGAGAQAGELVDRTLAKWSRLREDLQSFIRKHDHRNTEPYTEAEAASYRRAFEALTGGRGVFGNDLCAHGRVRFDGHRRARPSAGRSGDGSTSTS